MALLYFLLLAVFAAVAGIPSGYLSSKITIGLRQAAVSGVVLFLIVVTYQVRVIKEYRAGFTLFELTGGLVFLVFFWLGAKLHDQHWVDGPKRFVRLQHAVTTASVVAFLGWAFDSWAWFIVEPEISPFEDLWTFVLKNHEKPGQWASDLVLAWQDLSGLGLGGFMLLFLLLWQKYWPAIISASAVASFIWTSTRQGLRI